jgi:metallo-beta-lactamase class B
MSIARQLLAGVVMSLGAGSLLFAQSAGDLERAAKDPVFFVETATTRQKWNEPAAPMKVVGPIYFVGTRGLCSWLITTPEGHVLIDSGMPPSGPMIEASIRALGFKPEDIKFLLAGHAHIDHVGGHAYLKKISGAQVVMLDREVDLMQSGGKTDFHYGAFPQLSFEPVMVDRVVKHGEKIVLGGMTLTALHTPGHTRGSTTWVTNVTDGGKRISVAFPEGTNVNPGYRLIKNPSYPGIADDYRRKFGILTSLKPDIWLSPHAEVIGLDAKRARAAKEGARVWIDPEGYRKWLADQRQKFDALVTAEGGSIASK